MKFGMISYAHTHAYSYAGQLVSHPDAELVAVWDENAERGQNAALSFRCRYCSDLNGLLDSGIDAVIVCSENSKHREHVAAAARAGKHVLCEKPIATEIADAEEMIRACREAGVFLSIAFPDRSSFAVKQARKIIQAGELGEIVAINSTNHGRMSPDWFAQKQLSGGGAAIDHIVHLVDSIRWILKVEVKRVYAELDTRLYNIQVEDCGIVMLELESGVIASIDPSWSRPSTFPTWGDLIMEFVGTRGTLTVDLFKQSSLFYNDADNKVEMIPWLDDIDQGLIDDFVQNVKHGKMPSITGEDGLRTLEVVKAAYASNESNQFVTIR